LSAESRLIWAPANFQKAKVRYSENA
jgi:hypothetical protein